MKAVIDLGSEFLIDRTQIRLPQLRLLLAAIGEPMAKGSPWVAISKRIAALHHLPLKIFFGEANQKLPAA
ncbi:MAG: hypothetical protein JWL69_1291 [Phycisphaerales bacterium]|nr:hypothetical protein [Phycisphaerales bacterium]